MGYSCIVEGVYLADKCYLAQRVDPVERLHIIRNGIALLAAAVGYSGSALYGRSIYRASFLKDIY